MELVEIFYVTGIIAFISFSVFLGFVIFYIYKSARVIYIYKQNAGKVLTGIQKTLLISQIVFIKKIMSLLGGGGKK